MDFDGILIDFVEFNGFRQILKDFGVLRWLLVDCNEFLVISMDFGGLQRIFMNLNRCGWNSMILR